MHSISLKTFRGSKHGVTVNVGHLPEQAVNRKAAKERVHGVPARKPVRTRKRDFSAGKCNVLSGV